MGYTKHRKKSPQRKKHRRTRKYAKKRYTKKRHKKKRYTKKRLTGGAEDREAVVYTIQNCRDSSIQLKIEIGQIIGRGISGTVFAAKVTRKTETIMAAKVSRSDQDNIDEYAFYRTVRSHPNILTCYGLYKFTDITQEAPYPEPILLLQLCNDNLHNVIKEKMTGERTYDNFAKFAHRNFCRIGTALTQMHSVGIIHRDIKAPNILVRNHQGHIHSLVLSDLGGGVDTTRTALSTIDIQSGITPKNSGPLEFLSRYMGDENEICARKIEDFFKLFITWTETMQKAYNMGGKRNYSSGTFYLFNSRDMNWDKKVVQLQLPSIGIYENLQRRFTPPYDEGHSFQEMIKRFTTIEDEDVNNSGNIKTDIQDLGTILGEVLDLVKAELLGSELVEPELLGSEQLRSSLQSTLTKLNTFCVDLLKELTSKKPPGTPPDPTRNRKSHVPAPASVPAPAPASVPIPVPSPAGQGHQVGSAYDENDENDEYDEYVDPPIEDDLIDDVPTEVGPPIEDDLTLEYPPSTGTFNGMLEDTSLQPRIGPRVVGLLTGNIPF